MGDIPSLSHHLNVILELGDVTKYDPNIRAIEGEIYLYGQPKHFKAPSCILDVIQDDISESKIACFCADGNLYIQKNAEVTETSDDIALSEFRSKQIDCSIWHQTATIRILSFRRGFITLQALNDTLVFQCYEKIDDSTEKSLKTTPATSFKLAQKLTDKKLNVILKLIHSDSNKENNEADSDWMDPLTFAQLFGDASLLQSKVLLVGLPDGCIYSFPLKCWLGKSEEKENLQLLCCLDQPVMGIFLLNTSSDGTPLLLLGSRGKAVLFRTSKGSFSVSANVKFHEFYLPGPIISCDVNKNTLLHSDGQYLWYTDIPTLITSLEKEGNLYKQSQQIDVFGIRLVFLIEELATEMQREALLFHEDGKLYRMKLDITGASKSHDVARPLEDIGTILHRIQQQGITLAKYEAELQHQKDIIANLSIVSSFLLNKKAELEFPTCCKVNHFNGCAQSTFQISILNKSIHKLQQGFWSISVSLNTEDDEVSPSKKCQVHCFALLSDLEPGRNAEFLFPVELNLTKDKWDLPIYINITLKFMLPDRYVLEEAAIPEKKEDTDDTNTPVIIAGFELSPVIIDALYILSNCFKENSIVHRIENPSAEEVLLDLVEKRKRALKSCNESDSVCETYKFKQRNINHVIRISPKLVEKISLEDADETNPCSKLLCFLKQDSQQHLPREISETLNAECIDKPLKLNVSLEENLIAVGIQVQDIELFSRVRRALIRRLQTISLPPEEVEEGQIVIPRSCLIQVNKLLTTLNNLPDDEEHVGHLLDLYLQLRNNVSALLPII